MCKVNLLVYEHSLNMFFPVLGKVGQQAAEECREWRAVGSLEDRVGEVVRLVGSLPSEVVVTRSQRGHIVSVEAGRGSQLWGEMTVGGATFMALSSSTSLCSLLFCSVSDPNHLFKYSHSISVCFSLLLFFQYSSHQLNYSISSYIKFT